MWWITTTALNYKLVKNYIVTHLISSQTKFPNVAIKKCFYNVGTVWWEGNSHENTACIKCTNVEEIDREKADVLD